MVDKRKNIGTAVKRNITGTYMVAVLLGMMGDSRESQLLGWFSGRFGQVPAQGWSLPKIRSTVRSYHCKTAARIDDIMSMFLAVVSLNRIEIVNGFVGSGKALRKTPPGVSTFGTRRLHFLEESWTRDEIQRGFRKRNAGDSCHARHLVGVRLCDWNENKPMRNQIASNENLASVATDGFQVSRPPQTWKKERAWRVKKVNL